MASYNMNSHWVTPISDQQYKDNYNSIFSKKKKSEDKDNGQKAKGTASSGTGEEESSSDL